MCAGADGSGDQALPPFRDGLIAGRCRSRAEDSLFSVDYLQGNRLCSCRFPNGKRRAAKDRCRSEEHTSELQSPCNLVCRLLLEKKKRITNRYLELLYTHTLDDTH